MGSSRSLVTINKILFHHHQCSREQSRALVCFQPVYPIVKNVLIFKILGYHQQDTFSSSPMFTGTKSCTCLFLASIPYCNECFDLQDLRLPLTKHFFIFIKVYWNNVVHLSVNYQ